MLSLCVLQGFQPCGICVAVVQDMLAAATLNVSKPMELYAQRHVQRLSSFAGRGALLSATRRVIIVDKHLLYHLEACLQSLRNIFGLINGLKRIVLHDQLPLPLRNFLQKAKVSANSCGGWQSALMRPGPWPRAAWPDLKCQTATFLTTFLIGHPEVGCLDSPY